MNSPWTACCAGCPHGVYLRKFAPEKRYGAVGDVYHLYTANAGHERARRRSREFARVLRDPGSSRSLQELLRLPYLGAQRRLGDERSRVSSKRRKFRARYFLRQTFG